MSGRRSSSSEGDRKSTRLNSSHTVIYTLSLQDALPIYRGVVGRLSHADLRVRRRHRALGGGDVGPPLEQLRRRSEEHTSELQSHRDLHSFPTRRSSDLPWGSRPP